MGHRRPPGQVPLQWMALLGPLVKWSSNSWLHCITWVHGSICPLVPAWPAVSLLLLTELTASSAVQVQKYKIVSQQHRASTELSALCLPSHLLRFPDFSPHYSHRLPPQVSNSNRNIIFPWSPSSTRAFTSQYISSLNIYTRTNMQMDSPLLLPLFPFFIQRTPPNASWLLHSSLLLQLLISMCSSVFLFSRNYTNYFSFLSILSAIPPRLIASSWIRMAQYCPSNKLPPTLTLPSPLHCTPPPPR